MDEGRKKAFAVRFLAESAKGITMAFYSLSDFILPQKKNGEQNNEQENEFNVSSVLIRRSDYRFTDVTETMYIHGDRSITFYEI